MKLIKGYYIPNSTEIKKAAAKLRRMERENPCNHFDCVFTPENGLFNFHEFVDVHSYVDYGTTPHFYVVRDIGTTYDGGYELHELLTAFQDFIESRR